jgi:alkanesulfonate monooxygenase
MNTPLRFHWSLSQAGDGFRRSGATSRMTGLPSRDAQLELCRCAERNGIESMLMAIGFTRPDPMLLALSLGMDTTSINFMVACRAGLISPTMFVQQINTLSALLEGRVCINIVGGHTPTEQRYYGDFLEHDERYARTDEFLSVCEAFWRGDGEVDFNGRYYTIEKGKVSTPFVSRERRSPEIFVGGNSGQALELARGHASCLWRFAEAPDALREKIAPLLPDGVETGLLMGLIVRPEHDEAVAAANALIEQFGAEARDVQRSFVGRSDSVAYNSTFNLANGSADGWITPTLWSGAVPYLGAPSMALVGSPEEVADAIIEYRRAGITQFLFIGWPDHEEMERFGRDVLPLVRGKERMLEESSVVAREEAGPCR